MSARSRRRGRGALLAEELSSPAADRTADDEDVGGFLEVRLQRGHGVAGEVDELGVAEDVAEHRLGALVVGVELVEGSLKPLLRIANRAPRAEIGPRVGGEVVGRAGREQVGLGGKVAVEGAALHARPLGDRAQRRAGRPDGSVQFDRRLGDPLVRLGHLLGALLQLVLALGLSFATHHRVANLDRSRAGAYGRISVTHCCVSKGVEDGDA